MDVDVAFMNNYLVKGKIVYIEIPEGVKNISPEFRKNNVCKLEKSLYEIKVSPKRWYFQFKETQICIFYWRRYQTIVIVLLQN